MPLQGTCAETSFFDRTAPIFSQRPLNGLRGLAIHLILLVQSFQFAGFGTVLAAGWTGRVIAAVPNAFFGVPLFFVISGYLITSILLCMKTRYGTASDYYRVFFVRRALRIIPLYYVFIFGVFFGVPMAQQHGLMPFGAEAGTDVMPFWGAILFLINLPPFHSPRYLLVAWSVCVEMQFWVVFNALLLA